MPALVPVLRLRKTGRVQFAGIPAQGNKMKCQGDHGGCRAKYRCCLPALAGFLSPHSMGPGAHNKAAPPFRFKEKRQVARESASNKLFGRRIAQNRNYAKQRRANLTSFWICSFSASSD